MIIRLVLLCSLLIIKVVFGSLSSCSRKNPLEWFGAHSKKIIQNEIKPITLSKMTCFGRGREEELAFTMGTDQPVFVVDGESPPRTVRLSPFCMDQTEVSNLQFYQFVKETNYKTEAELLGDSFCMINYVSNFSRRLIKGAAAQARWWVVVHNATWMTPEGIDSNIYTRWNHPVIHISWNDADAYCKYFDKRLPTEAEWEYACRGGRENRLYPWGNDVSKHRMNIWHGHFPDVNTGDDGFQTTAPVDQFVQNKFNMKNIAGNVWEWVNDWWHSEHSNQTVKNPIGPITGKEKVKKGGSFMCTPSFCHRYRCAARNHNTPDTTAVNIGFRCAKNL